MPKSSYGQNRRCPFSDKKSYAQEKDATEAARKVEVEHNHEEGYLNVYRCELCGRWHMTHKEVKRKEVPVVGSTSKFETPVPITQKIVFPEGFAERFFE